MSEANKKQHGGNHYKQFQDHEPWDVITAWGLGYLDGTAVKYLARWKHKGGIEDLRKAGHFIEKLIEVEEARANQNSSVRTRKRKDLHNRGSSRSGGGSTRRPLRGLIR